MPTVMGKGWKIMTGTARRRQFAAFPTAPPAPFEADLNFIARTAVHELREPVQAIHSFLCVLLEERTGELSDLQRDFLSTADQATRRLKRRINDLQLAVTESSDLIIQPETMDLVCRVEACCHELSQIAIAHGIEFNIDTPSTITHATIWADPDRIDQILLNLIENAIQYSAQGSKVSIGVQAGSPGTWTVAIRNETATYLNEDPALWFLPRTRGQNGIASRTNGQGLGLTAAEKLTRLQGGEIHARVGTNTVEISVAFPVSSMRSVENCNGLDAAIHSFGDA